MFKSRIILLLFITAVCASCHSAVKDDQSTQTPPPEGSEGTAETYSDELQLETKTFEVSDENILNPERGLYDWIDLLDSGDDYSDIRQKGYTLAYVRPELAAFRNSSISAGFLQLLKDGLGRVRKAGIKIILRFRYDDNEDATLSKILEHIAQLKPVLEENADVIAAMQAGFIGKWGEWHSSSYGLDNAPSRKQVLDALLGALPASRMVQLRTPKFKTEYLGTSDPLTEAGAFGGSAAARIGHHNDCFLASATDMGTYPSSEIDKWKDYIAADAQFTPLGGETCAVNPPRSDCDTATSEMAKLHWSFINISYKEDVILGWKTEGCFNDIEKNLGYRFVLSEASWDKEVKGVLHLKVKMNNNGYAALFNERPIYAVINGPQCYEAKLISDPRKWGSGAASEFSTTIKLPDAVKAGQYSLALWLPDPSTTLEKDPRYAIRFANKDIWNDANGYNVLTTSLNVLSAASSGTTEAEFKECE